MIYLKRNSSNITVSTFLEKAQDPLNGKFIFLAVSDLFPESRFYYEFKTSGSGQLDLIENNVRFDKWDIRVDTSGLILNYDGMYQYYVVEFSYKADMKTIISSIESLSFINGNNGRLLETGRLKVIGDKTTLDVYK